MVLKARVGSIALIRSGFNGRTPCSVTTAKVASHMNAFETSIERAYDFQSCSSAASTRESRSTSRSIGTKTGSSRVLRPVKTRAMYRPSGMLVAIVIAPVRTTARISVPMRLPASAEPLGADHRVKEVEAGEQAHGEENDIHPYTRSQKRMKRSNAPNTARPKRIIAPRSILDSFQQPDSSRRKPGALVAFPGQPCASVRSPRSTTRTE